MILPSGIFILIYTDYYTQHYALEKRSFYMRRFILLLITIISAIPSFSETVSQKEAQRIAQLFFNESAGNVTAPPKLVYNGRKLTTNRLFTPFYVYNTPLGGFVIISAENKAYPILGFSLKEGFDPNKLGETETALLKSYAVEIELVRYDSDPIENTIHAWQNLAEFISGILNSRYIATDPRISIEESERMLNNAFDKDDAVFSDIYTPDQWREMIGEELFLKESAPMGFIYKDEILPAVVYGRQGDYFRIEMTSRNNWLMRLNATDVIPSAMISVVMNPLEIPWDLEEEIPFAFHDEFVEEIYQNEEKRRLKSSIDLPQNEGEPFLKADGGGHYEIILPENIRTARIYNISGALVRKNSYGPETNVAHVDISAEPSGFYIITIEGITGRPYGFKISR